MSRGGMEMDMDSLEEKLHRERAKLAGMKRGMCSNPNFPFFLSAVGEQKKYGKELESDSVSV